LGRFNAAGIAQKKEVPSLRDKLFALSELLNPLLSLIPSFPKETPQIFFTPKPSPYLKQFRLFARLIKV